MEFWKMIFLFKQVIFRFHVNFPGCISFWGVDFAGCLWMLRSAKDAKGTWQVQSGFSCGQRNPHIKNIYNCHSSVNRHSGIAR